LTIGGKPLFRIGRSRSAVGDASLGRRRSTADVTAGTLGDRWKALFWVDPEVLLKVGSSTVDVTAKCY
jgi:hypothetical protein